MSFGLNQKIINQLKTVFKKYPVIKRVKIYGSRARGDYERGSDIDLALFCESKKDLSSRISWELDELSTPYLFDVVNYDKIQSQALKKEVNKYGKLFYIKESILNQEQLIKKPEKFSLNKSQQTVVKGKGISVQDRDKIVKPDIQQKLFDKNKSKMTKRGIDEKSTENKTKQTEIGEIPKNWKIFLFKNCIRKIAVNRVEKQIQTNQYLKSGKFPIIDQGKNFISGWTNNKSILLSKELPLIIFGDHTRIFKYVDKPFVLGADGTRLIKPNDNYDIRFFYYLMQKTSIPNKGYNRHYKILKEILLPRPPLQEQKEIADILSTIQKAIQTQDKLIERTEELKKSTMKQLFTYGVKGGGARQTEAFLNGKSAIENNLKWPMVSLEDVAKITSGQSPKSKYYNKNGKGLPFYQGKTEFTEIYISSPKIWTNKAIKIAKKNDILMSVRAPVGPVNIAIQKSCIGRGLAAIHPKKVNQLFLFYYLNLFENKIKGHGGTVFDSINREQVKSIKIPCPPLFDQEEIANTLTKIDQKIQIHKKKQSKLKELFKTMLSKLMTSQISVQQLNINTKSIKL